MKRPKKKVDAVGKTKWLARFGNWIATFLTAVAEARIPPSKMQLVPEQGSINLVTGLLGIVLYTAAGQINAGTKSAGLTSQIIMAAVGAVLLFLAAVIVIFTARGRSNILDDWKKTTSVFVVVWLLSLVVFLLLTYPLLLVNDNLILLDRIAYAIDDRLSSEAVAWRADLIKSLICTFCAGLILIYRTKRSDKTFSLRSIQPWLWLALMTVVVGFVFDTSLYRPARS
jgi:uncharacterized membrane protein